MLEMGLSDAELAALLGHEIGHVIGNHFSRSKRLSSILSLAQVALLVGAIVAADGSSGSTRYERDDDLVYTALAWEHLYEAWFPGSGEEPADLPSMKRFRRRPETLGWRRVDLDCCIALR